MKDFVIATFIALFIVNLIESIDKEKPIDLPVSISGINSSKTGTDKVDSVINDFKIITRVCLLRQLI